MELLGKAVRHEGFNVCFERRVGCHTEPAIRFNEHTTLAEGFQKIELITIEEHLGAEDSVGSGTSSQVGDKSTGLGFVVKLRSFASGLINMHQTKSSHPEYREERRALNAVRQLFDGRLLISRYGYREMVLRSLCMRFQFCATSPGCL